MRYRELGKTGKLVSNLGFGVMRLPYEQDNPNTVDRKKAFEMLRYAYSQGVNYFDTAQNYLKGESESVLGEAVEGFRDKIYIATKVGIWHINDGGIKDIEELLESQLKRLRTDYIDFYMIHALTDQRWSTFKNIGILDFLEKKKREGIIHHYGFSYHGTSHFFKELVGEYDWDFAQIQFNYVDDKIQAGEDGLAYAHKKGLGTIIMEPLKGGQLTYELPQEAKEYLQSVAPDKTLAEWGLNWLWNREDIDLVLSGMGDMKQVEENIRLASNATPNMMSQKELAAIAKAKEIYSSLIKVKCTKCRYCVTCPKDIYIYNVFEAYNYAFTASLEKAKRYFGYNRDQVTKCISCGQCEKNCPQGIKIADKLKEAYDFFDSCK